MGNHLPVTQKTSFILKPVTPTVHYVGFHLVYENRSFCCSFCWILEVDSYDVDVYVIVNLDFFNWFQPAELSHGVDPIPAAEAGATRMQREEDERARIASEERDRELAVGDEEEDDDEGLC